MPKTKNVRYKGTPVQEILIRKSFEAHLKLDTMQRKMKAQEEKARLTLQDMNLESIENMLSRVESYKKQRGY